MRAFKRKIFWVAIISGLLLFVSFHPFVAAQEEKSTGMSLKFQSVVSGVWNKITQVIPILKNENYKEKYFKILRKFAELKLQEKETQVGQSFEVLKAKYPNLVQLKTLKIGEAGVIYLERQSIIESKEGKFDKIKEGAVVLDDNSPLVGKVYRSKLNFLEIRSLEYPGVEFNISNIDGIFLGTGKTTGLGYIEIDFIDPKVKDIEKDELVMTYGNDKVYSQNFIFGRVVKVENQTSFIKAIIEPIANFSSDYYFIIP